MNFLKSIIHKPNIASGLIVGSRSSIISVGSGTNNLNTLSRFSTNITYSGGQAIEGQGGYYGSGGSRKTLDPTTVQKEGLVAMAVDVSQVRSVMSEVEGIETLLAAEEEANIGQVTSKQIELKSNIKKLLTAPEFSLSLKNLEFSGLPKWGLSNEERELVMEAKEKVKSC